MPKTKKVIELSEEELKKILCKDFNEPESNTKVIIEKKTQVFPFHPEIYTIKLEIEI